MTRCGSCT